MGCFLFLSPHSLPFMLFIVVEQLHIVLQNGYQVCPLFSLPCFHCGLDLCSAAFSFRLATFSFLSLTQFYFPFFSFRMFSVFFGWFSIFISLLFFGEWFLFLIFFCFFFGGGALVWGSTVGCDSSFENISLCCLSVTWEEKC